VQNVSRQSETDHALLRVQLGEDEAVEVLNDTGLQASIADAFRAATGLSVEVALADKSLPNDGVLIEDERDYEG